jgi:vitamin B12 transporter
MKHPLSKPLLLAGACAFAIAPSQAQTTSSVQPDMVVTATREATPVNQAIADVTVIGPKEIQSSPSRNLTELLTQQAGIEISMSGGLGATSSAFVRGTNSNHFLLLIDGMRFGSATAGNPSLENIPLAQVERIEIVRGPLSGLYGSDALGGVIQIFTKTGQGSGNRFTPNAQLTLGSQGFGQLSTGFAGRQDAFDYALQLQTVSSRGFSATNPKVAGFPPFGTYHPDDDGFKQNSLSLNLGYRFNPDWALRFSALNSNARTEFDEGYDPTNPKQSGLVKLQAQNFSLALEGRLSNVWTSKFSLGQSKDVNDTVGALNNFFISTFTTKQTQAVWDNRFKTAMGDWNLGLEYLSQQVALADLFATPNFAPDHRSIKSAWLGWSMQRGAWQVQTNLRHDSNSQYGGKTSGNLGMAYKLNEAWRVQGSIANGFAAPSFNNLYFPFFGNPNLKPESSLSRELGLRYNGNFGWGGSSTSNAQSATPSEFKLVYFRQTIRDLIVVDPTLFSPVNLDSAKIQGLSAQLRHRAGAWTTNASLDLTDPVNDSGGAQQGNLLPRRAKQNLRVSADYDFGSWQLGGGLRAASRRFDNASNTTALAGYGLIDVRARMPINAEWSLALNLRNLSNKTYETAYGFNQAGRQVFLTVNYQGKP